MIATNFNFLCIDEYISENYSKCGLTENDLYKKISWHVGVYQDSKYICAGTLISENIVISSARCFRESPSDTEAEFENVER